MSAHARRSSIAHALGIAIVIGSAAACGAGGATPSPTPTSVALPAAPSFTLGLGDPVATTLSSEAAPPIVTCATPTTGAWSLMYIGADPSLTVDLVLFDGAATTDGSSNFDLNVDAASFGTFKVVPSGYREGTHGTTGSVSIHAEAGAHRMTVEGMGLARGGAVSSDTLVPVTFELVCPAS